MEDFNSKYTGAEVEALLDDVAENMATTDYVNTAINNAITTTLNTPI